MSTVNLKYGKTSIEIDLDGAKSIDTLVEKPMREIEDIEKEFRYSIEDGVIGVLPLKDLIKSDDKVTVIISDLTRFWMRQDIICSLLVKYLREDMNIPTENIAVLIARKKRKRLPGNMHIITALRSLTMTAMPMILNM